MLNTLTGKVLAVPIEWTLLRLFVGFALFYFTI